jgi:hypothetical protein
MNNKALIFGMLAVILFDLSFALWATFGNLADTLAIALIASVTAVGTIIGSIYVAQTTSLLNAVATRNEETRNLKKVHYHIFMETLANQLAHTNSSNQIKKQEIDQKLFIEINRLKLYASQKVVEWIEQSQKPKSNQGSDFSEFFMLIRDDLCTDGFEKFKELPTIVFRYALVNDTTNSS